METLDPTISAWVTHCNDVGWSVTAKDFLVNNYANEDGFIVSKQVLPDRSRLCMVTSDSSQDPHQIEQWVRTANSSKVIVETVQSIRSQTIIYPSLHKSCLSLTLYKGVPNLGQFHLPKSHRSAFHITHAQMIMPRALARFDTANSGLERCDWLEKSRDHSNSLVPGSVAVVANRGMEGDMCGYGAVRLGNQCAMIGPIYADCDYAARSLLLALIKSFRPAREKGITMAVLSINSGAHTLAKDIGLRPVAAIDRYWYGQDFCPEQFDHIYASSNYPMQLV